MYDTFSVKCNYYLYLLLKLNHQLLRIIFLDGEGKEIKAPADGEVPRAFVPDTIMNYVNEKYPEIKVQKIEKESYGYEIDLSNKTELQFDHNGGFIKED